MLAILNQTKSNEWVFELIDSDRARTIVIKRIEVLSEFFELLVLEDDAVVLSVLAKPLALLTLGVENQVLRLYSNVLNVLVLTVVVEVRLGLRLLHVGCLVTLSRLLLQLVQDVLGGGAGGLWFHAFLGRGGRFVRLASQFSFHLFLNQ